MLGWFNFFKLYRNIRLSRLKLEDIIRTYLDLSQLHAFFPTVELLFHLFDRSLRARKVMKAKTTLRNNLPLPQFADWLPSARTHRYHHLAAL